MAASVQQRIAFGERAGQQVRRMGSGFGAEGEYPLLSGPRCASVQGFSLHANTHVPAHRRDQLERLIRYTARGAVSLERLTKTPTAISSIPLLIPGPMAPRGFGSRPWNSWRSWRRSCPCRASTWCAMAGVWHRPVDLRGAIIPTPRQQGVDEEQTETASPRGVGHGC